jgi:hypothetical protein
MMKGKTGTTHFITYIKALRSLMIKKNNEISTPEEKNKRLTFGQAQDIRSHPCNGG